MDYRREIDGLRAIAVVPVIFFHAGFAAFSGGFVGVDVFFVISGYLITSIILKEKAQGRFSLLTFYERRARRILPALFFVMLACLPYAWLWLRPRDLQDFSQSLVAIPIFASNFLFWRESGYFAESAELKPLLHTWSLAVEEQYYLLFPLLLMLPWTLRRRWTLAALIAIGIVSMLFAHWGSRNEPAAAFFLLPARAWELMIGAVLAVLFLHGNIQRLPVVHQRGISEILGTLGLILIAYAVVAFDAATPYPSLYALVPTLGTALVIIFGTSQTAVGRLLGHRALVGIGLVSYSAYLWHQPLFAFARHRSPTEPSDWLYLGLSIFAIALAYLSWRYVELPFRRKDTFSRKAVLTFALAGSAILGGIGAVGHLTNGFIGRTDGYGQLLAELDHRIRPNLGLSVTCDGDGTFSPACRTSESPEIVVWGDSYAMHLVQGILASNPSAQVVQLTKSACGPIFGLTPISNQYPIRWSEECYAFTEKVRDWLRSNDSVRYAVLSSPFAQYLSANWQVIIDGRTVDTSLKLAARELRRTLEELVSLGIEPVIFSPPPANGVNIGRCLVKARMFSINLDYCNFRYDVSENSHKSAYLLLESIAGDYPVVWLNEMICQNGRCGTHFGTNFIYRDGGHLSYEGSSALGRHANFYGLITSRD